MKSQSIFSAAALLGLLQAFLWAFQHPFESLFYREAVNLHFGLVEAVFYSKAIGFALMSSLFLVPGSATSFMGMVRSKARWKILPLCLFLSFSSIALYAFGQSRLEGVMVSLIIASSPFSYHLSLILLNSHYKEWRQNILKFFRSSHFVVHVVILVVFFASYSLSNKQLTGMDWLAVASIVLVPLSFFLSGNAMVALALGLSPLEEMNAESASAGDYVAAALIVSLCSMLLVTLLIVALSVRCVCYPTPLVISEMAWWLFLASAIVSGFGGHFFYYWRLREDQKKLEIAGVFHHFTAPFSAIIGFAIAYFFLPSYTPFWFYLYAAPVIALIIYLWSRREERKERPAIPKSLD